jgi:hypothetical protein
MPPISMNPVKFDSRRLQIYKSLYIFNLQLRYRPVGGDLGVDATPHGSRNAGFLA